MIEYKYIVYPPNYKRDGNFTELLSLKEAKKKAISLGAGAKIIRNCESNRIDCRYLYSDFSWELLDELFENENYLIWERWNLRKKMPSNFSFVRKVKK